MSYRNTFVTSAVPIGAIADLRAVLDQWATTWVVDDLLIVGVNKTHHVGAMGGEGEEFARLEDAIRRHLDAGRRLPSFKLMIAGEHDEDDCQYVWDGKELTYFEVI